MPNRLAMVRAVAARLGTAHTVRDVADATMSAAAEFLGAHTSSLWLITEDRTALELRFERNANPEAAALYARMPLSAEELPGPYVVATGEAQFVRSLRERNALWPALAGTPSNSEALAVLPLDVDGRSLGVVSFSFLDERDFDDQDRVALLAVADQCALGLDRAAMYEATRERADGQSLLAALSAIDTTTGWEAIARRATTMCASEFVDTCAVYVREGHLVRRVAFASRSHPELSERLEDHFPTPISSPSLHARVVREGAAQRVPAVQPGQLSAASPAPGYAEALRDVRLGEGWVFPMGDPSGTFGAMMFLGRPGEDLSGDAVELAHAAAERTANLIVSATTFAEQRAALAALQGIVLPGEVDTIDGIEVVARYVPIATAGTIGGDWWDALALPSGDVAVTIGDVAGHGIAPAAVMGHARNALRMQLVSGNGPGGALASVSAFLDWTHPLAHCTAIAATVSPETGTLRWSCAGHPPLLCVAGDGAVSYLEATPAPPLGVKTRGLASYAEKTVVLDEDSTVLLYTDGLIEGHERTVDDGLKLLAKVASDIVPSDPLDQVADRILAELVDHQEDDVCLVALRWQPTRTPD